MARLSTSGVTAPWRATNTDGGGVEFSHRVALRRTSRNIVLTVRTIVTYPDSRLRTPASRVTVFDDVLRALAADLLDTMRSADGVGITGPHIGAMQRIVVLQLPDMPEPITYVNPDIVWASPEVIQHEEGSISMSGVTERIVRPAAVKVRYDTLDGEEKVEDAEGFRAVCHQHEIDQLNGIFWLEKLSRLKQQRLATRFAKMTRA